MLKEEKNKSFNLNISTKTKSSDYDRYKTLFESINAGAFITSLDGKIIEANLNSCYLLDYTWEELENMNFVELFPKHVDWAVILEEIKSKGGMNFETESIKKDGTVFPVAIDTSLFIFEKRPVMLALLWDITKRKKAEKQLKESEQKYEGLFESTTDGMLVLDARGEILDINDKALEIFGKKKEEMIKNNFLSMGLLTAKALSIVVKQFHQLLSKNISTTNDADILDKNNDLLTVELTSFFLTKKENEVSHFVLIIRDISDRKKTEIKLAREHELLTTLMNNLPDPVYFKDDSNKYLMVNKAKAANNNTTPNEMIGKTDFDFMPPDKAQKAFEEDEEIIKTGKFIIEEAQKNVKEDGKERWISVTKIPRFDEEGTIIGVMSIKKDITYWKKLEEKNKE